MIKKILICGSGTGGHFYPAYAFYESLKKISHTKIIFVGVGKPIEKPIEKDLYIEYIKIPMVSSSLLRSNFIAFFFRFFISFIASFFTLLFNRPGVVICFGGYTSLPVGIAARFLFIRVILHEQNAVMGKANRMLKNMGAKCFSHFGLSGTRQLHNPLRYSIIERRFFPDKLKFNIKNDNKVLLITGGSQGASAINEAIFGIVNRFMEDERFDGWEVIHITGENDYSRGRVHGNNHHRYQCYKYMDNIGDVYAITDIALTRAGSLTLSELAYYDIKKIIVPYPYASDNHQAKNALYYESKYGDTVVPQEHFNSRLLYDILISMTAASQPKPVLKYEDNIRRAIDEYSGENMVNIILNKNV